MSNKRRGRPRANPVEETYQPVVEVKTIVPMNKEQADLIKTIHNNDLVVVSGKAGSGKSYICAGLACEYLSRGIVDKIVITRCCVGVEDLGYLGGTVFDRIEPYIQAIMIELGNFINVKKEIASGRLEIIPIAYMRGRTLRNSFVILEEAQNANLRQIKMFLTRMGECSKFLINGDISQTDLVGPSSKDYSDFINRLKRIAVPEKRIAVFELLRSVRHPLVEEILSIFDY